jgi:hypothetical protein
MAIHKVMTMARIGTLAEILAGDGDYVGQEGICTNYGGEIVTGPVGLGESRIVKGGARLQWYSGGWGWREGWQSMSVMLTARTAPDDLLQNELYAYSAPLLGPCDGLRMEHHWELTNNANNKNARLTLGTSGSMQAGAVTNLKGKPSAVMFGEFWNMNDPEVQEWLTNDENVIGPLAGSFQGTTKGTGDAGIRFAIEAEKATNTDLMVLRKARVWLFGGGFPLVDS